jgi:hypothetical protein
MAGHGGGIPIGFASLQRFAKSLKSAVSADAVVGDAEIPGFSHFLDGGTGILDQSHRFKFRGVPPTFDETSQAALQGLMGRLGYRMSVPYEILDNTRIPAGYTYLLQLVAHDLVQSSVSASLVGDPNGRVRNNRQYRLTLDTVYGSGPEVNSCIYAIDGAGAPVRTTLRLGQMKSHLSPCPFRDIGRVLPANQTGFELFSGLTDVLIADARNDDNAILSQFLTLFHLLHNALVAKISEFAQDGVASPEAVAVRSFQCATAAVTLIYRNIIRNDLMKRILHPDIYAAYKDVVKAEELVHPPDGRLPLEFSHAAFRFGHAMIRDLYRINTPPAETPGAPVIELAIFKAMMVTSGRSPSEMPLDATWIVKWSNFFDINNSSPNPSQKIRPSYNRGLIKPFPALGATEEPGLAGRDLFSSVQLGLWSVNALIERLKATEKLGISAAMRASRLASDKARRISSLKTWLSQHPAKWQDGDVDAIAEEPPLLFYILFEAWADSAPKDQSHSQGDDPGTEDEKKIEGTHLGIVGSILVADAIFGALTDRLLYEEREKPGAPKLADSLKKLSDTFFDESTNVFDDVPPLENMAQLVTYIAKLARLQNAEPPFL